LGNPTAKSEPARFFREVFSSRRLPESAVRHINPLKSAIGDRAMGDVVNLNRFRKTREKAERTKEAEANRARFGRTKTEKERDRKEAERKTQTLDGHKLDGED
jgi:hypothetical protein